MERQVVQCYPSKIEKPSRSLGNVVTTELPMAERNPQETCVKCSGVSKYMLNKLDRIKIVLPPLFSWILFAFL